MPAICGYQGGHVTTIPLRKEAFRVNKSKAQKAVERKRRLVNRKRRIQWRLRDRQWTDQPRLMFGADNIHYELADRGRGLGPGGIGAMHLPARRTGLVEAIDRRLHLLMVKRQPSDYHPTRRQVGRGELCSSVRRPTEGQEGIMLRLFGD